jgi:hypothetical protein
MSTPNIEGQNIKELIVNQLDQLPPQLLDTVGDFVAFLLTRSQSPSLGASIEIEPETVAEQMVTAVEDDPIVGLIEGTPDLATNAEDILREEVKSDSGWSCR